MEKLLDFLITNITGIKDYKIESSQSESGGVQYIIKTPQEYIGLIIGKGGRTIKVIRSLLKVKATLDKEKVNLTVSEL